MSGMFEAMKRRSNPAKTLGRVAGAMLILVLGLASVECLAASLSELWQKAVQAYVEQRYPASIEFLQQYLQHENDRDKYAAAQLFLADSYRLGGPKSAAEKLYQTLADSGPNGPVQVSARFRQAEMAYNAGEYNRAAEIFHSLGQDPQADFLFPQIRLAWVKSCLKLKRLAEAQTVFNQLLGAYPRALLDPEIKFLFGIMKEYQGQLIDALKIYEELKTNPLAQLFAGSILEGQGRFLPAIAAYNRVLEKAQQDSHKEMALYFKTRAFYKSGDYLAAERLCRMFLAEHPRGPFTARTALLRVLILLAQARFQDVLMVQSEWQAAWPELNREDQSLVHAAAGEAWINLDQPVKAIEQYTQALDLTRDNRAEIVFKLAYAHMAVADYEQSFSRIRDYFQATDHPTPLAHLISTRVSLHQQRAPLAFRSAQFLAEQNDPLAEVAFYFMADHYAAHGDYKTLLAQWALLEKSIKNRTPAVEFRRVAAWSRLLVAEGHYLQGDYDMAQTYYLQALEIYNHPEVKPHVYRGLLWCSFQRQEYRQVLEQSQRLLSLRDVPEAMAREVRLLRAHAFFNLQDYTEAVRAYQEWMKTGAQQSAAPSVLFQIGWAHYLSQQYLEAIESWQSLAATYPQSPETREALHWVADTYFQAGENSRARAVYEDLLLRTSDAAVRRGYELRIAQTYYNEQNDAEAIRRFAALWEGYPETDEAEEARKGIEAASYRITDRLDQLDAFREYIVKFPKSNLAEDIQYRIGEAYYQKEMYAQSLQEFLQFILAYTKSPRTPNAQYYIAVCQEQLGQHADAVLQSAAFVQNYPQHELAPEMSFRLAASEFQLERYAEAAEHFAACGDQYSLKEYQSRAWYNAAVTYEKLKLPETALVYYGKLVEAYPQDANAPVSWSRIALLAAAQKNTAAAAAALAALERSADKALLQKTWLALAAIYQEQNQGELRQAMLVQVMQQGIPSSEDYSLALVELASLYESQKAWAEALQVYRRLAKIAVQDEWRQAAQKRVKLLQRIISGKN